jgi:uncharacterized sodium:solute symporter family permease YidK
MVTSVDFWIGRMLFLPPIIMICRLTRQSQFAVSRLFWFIAALDGLYRSDTWVSVILFGLLSIFMMVSASLRADVPTYSVRSIRMLAVGALLIYVGVGIVTGEWDGIEFWVLVLFAEYAATIQTLPPRESKKARRPASGANPAP